jgi:hypothetical protein
MPKTSVRAQLPSYPEVQRRRCFVREIFPIAVVVVIVVVVTLTELAAAVLPILIVILLVPPEERADLATVIAAADSSHRLRLWRALRTAVAARRCARSSAASQAHAIHEYTAVARTRGTDGSKGGCVVPAGSATDARRTKASPPLR